MNRTITFLLTLILLSANTLVAQALPSPEEEAMSSLKANFADFGLTQTDVAELRISDSYESNGIRHVYVQQFYQGVPVYNGIAGMHFKNDELVYSTSNFSSGFDQQLPASAPTVAAIDAVMTAARPLDVNKTTAPVMLAQQGDKIVYSWTEVSGSHVTAQLVYSNINGKLNLAWQVYIEQVNTADMWLIQVDALTGQQIQRFNQTLYCSFDGSDIKGKNAKDHRHAKGCFADVPAINTNLPVHESLMEAAIDGSTYNVFPFGIEAPIFGERVIESEPADLEASPFGWHDTNGQPGPEFTITRGNNVRAYPDRDANNAPDTDVVVDGGNDLEFVDLFYEDGGDLEDILPAATAQLFYMNNMLHDFAWHHGFDEASGNFQQNNYGNGGNQGDPVLAEAQDGSGTNNANFGTPADGGSGRMQMFVWNNTGSTSITIEEPVVLASTINAGGAGWATDLDEAVTASVVIALDNTASPELVCEAVVNGDEVSGSVALIRRGDCFFEAKVANAEAAGAVAAIICNPENTIITMGATPDVVDPTIPSVLIEEFRCAEIRQQIANGEDVVITFPATTAPPPVDGDFDNGIIAHEIGHGYSNRLVGGPSQAGCLGNLEQMGEGWSDFFALATSPLNGAVNQPDGTEPRGIGNYATSRPTDGSGIRRQRYSTSMEINDFTYDDVITSGTPHPLGEIWATTLWDLYWALTNEYGFDSNLVSGTGGNNLAVQLVFEGMKSTNCNPGMVDGRNGILTADFLLNEGANVCTIWEVFARRGLGFSATQGSSNEILDGVEAFDLPPSCIPTVKISKLTDETTIDQGDEFEVTLTVRNDKAEAVTNVVVTDQLPNGLSVIESSVSVPTGSSFEIVGSEIIFTIPVLGTGDDGETSMSYEVSTDDNHSVTKFFDGVENGDEGWSFFPLNGEGLNLWEVTEDEAFEGDNSWFVPNAEEANDQVLFLEEPTFLEGDQPGMRFYTQYNTEAKWDAGILEISTDGGTSWANVGNERILRGNYRGLVEPSAFDATVTDFNSYWGVSEGWREVLVDLADLAGQEVILRWRFGSDAAETTPNTSIQPGWYIDNIELMDVFRYNGLATVTTDEGDTAEAFGQDGGVLVESTLLDDVVDPALGNTTVNVFPNPATDFVNVNVVSQRSGNATVQLLSVDGRMIAQQQIELLDGRNSASFNTANLASGVYLIQVLGADRIHTEKVTIQ